MANIIFKLFTTINFLPIFANKIIVLYQAFLSYIEFLLKSSNHHGIHSPFVFNFITKCLYDRNLQFSNQLKIFRHSLITNKNIIEIKDYGAGSKRFRSNKRTVSSIARYAGISNKRGKLLFNIIQYFKSEKILEIGTSLGIATSCLAQANSNAQIITLEGCPETAKIASNQFKKFKLDSIDIIIGEFKKTLPKVLHNHIFDLIYFDGNHQKKATINYFELSLPHTNNDSIFIFDDIHWNKGMEEAWDYIKKHEKVTISIDTFQWGIVFFRKEQPKQHFIIRI